MYVEPDRVRLAKLRDIETFAIGDTVIYCPRCSFQMARGCIGPSFCPECGERLHVSNVDHELKTLATSR